jgi:transcriptional regulator with XRE-family HTH domain
MAANLSTTLYDWRSLVHRVGRKFVSLRNQKDLRQEEVSRGSGIAQTTVSKVERFGYGDQLYLDRVLRLAEYYKLHPASLFYGDQICSPLAFQVAEAWEKSPREVKLAVLSLLNLPAHG